MANETLVLLQMFVLSIGLEEKSAQASFQAFTGRTILGFGFAVEKAQYLDLETLAAATLARECNYPIEQAEGVYERNCSIQGRQSQPGLPVLYRIQLRSGLVIRTGFPADIPPPGALSGRWKEQHFGGTKFT